ncbi:hypothetical protein BD626DRAFT_474684 [Schizophyllum amplum]|uniref:Uncharacterized protein n=1 Tax=Schizophyllum amplum TaxID=97359 RepID=A0A550CXW2_9AGAR|nr:hypothetical protein BD626DRAFT_474684 [Auriculariopsis ampla]
MNRRKSEAATNHVWNRLRRSWRGRASPILCCVARRRRSSTALKAGMTMLSRMRLLLCRTIAGLLRRHGEDISTRIVQLSVQRSPLSAQIRRVYIHLVIQMSLHHSILILKDRQAYIRLWDIPRRTPTSALTRQGVPQTTLMPPALSTFLRSVVQLIVLPPLVLTMGKPARYLRTIIMPVPMQARLVAPGQVTPPTDHLCPLAARTIPLRATNPLLRGLITRSTAEQHLATSEQAVRLRKPCHCTASERRPVWFAAWCGACLCTPPAGITWCDLGAEEPSTRPLKFLNCPQVGLEDLILTVNG